MFKLEIICSNILILECSNIPMFHHRQRTEDFYDSETFIYNMTMVEHP